MYCVALQLHPVLTQTPHTRSTQYTRPSRQTPHVLSHDPRPDQMQIRRPNSVFDPGSVQVPASIGHLQIAPPPLTGHRTFPCVARAWAIAAVAGPGPLRRRRVSGGPLVRLHPSPLALATPGVTLLRTRHQPCPVDQRSLPSRVAITLC